MKCNMYYKRPAPWPTPTRASGGVRSMECTYAHAPKSVMSEIQGGEDAEMRALRVLLVAFPEDSHEDIADAYTEADSDVNAAAELLTTRQPSVRTCSRSADVQNVWKNSIADRNSSEYTRQPVVGSDDLLMEKYGRGVGEIINRDLKQGNSLLHNLQLVHVVASPQSPHLNNLMPLGVRWDNLSSRVYFPNQAEGYRVSDDGMLPVGKTRKQKKSKDRNEEVAPADNTASRQANEEFLLSMLGEGFQLGIDVVRDVLGNFEGDTQKSLEVLLQMASPASQLTQKVDNQEGGYLDDKKLDGEVHLSHQLTKAYVDKASMQTVMQFQKRRENEPNMVPRAGEMAKSNYHHRAIKDETDRDHYNVKVSLDELKTRLPHADDRFLFDLLRSTNCVLRDAEQIPLDAGVTPACKRSISTPAVSKMGHGNRPNTLKTFGHKDRGDTLGSTGLPPLRALWADVKPTITPLKQNLADASLKDGSFEKTYSERKNRMARFKSYGDFDDYGRQRLCAHEHWRSMEYYFKEAAAAYDRGERCRAATLSEKGKEQKQLAQEADDRASDRIFQSKNKDIVNNITIDLHAQHVGEAIQVLKRHLQTLCSIPFVHILTVITGHGSHSSNGRAKIKPAVTGFLARSGISWEELNEGCLTIKMMDIRNKEVDMSDGD